MDDMRNTSAPLYGKAEPATAKTTMSVREMRQLLGLGKTDSYWLLHKNFFEVILINDKRRIVISSFEKWYANQVKYHKVNGPPPGEELCKRSYSILEVAEILKVDSDTVYTLIRQGKLKAETVDFWMRIPKEEFESVIMKYFNIDSETLQSKTVYDSEDSTYEYKPRGFEEVEYPEYPYSEVIGYTENSDGTITLTANVVFPYSGNSKVYAHEVVVRPLEDGGVQYVSNRIIPSEDNSEETWHTPRLTLEEWEELYGGE